MGAYRDSIEAVTGDRPETCPWQSLADPLVREVVEAYHACSSSDGVTPALLPGDPDHVVWEGLLHYRRTVDAVRRCDDEAKRG